MSLIEEIFFKKSDDSSFENVDKVPFKKVKTN